MAPASGNFSTTSKKSEELRPTLPERIGSPTATRLAATTDKPFFFKAALKLSSALEIGPHELSGEMIAICFLLPALFAVSSARIVPRAWDGSSKAWVSFEEQEANNRARHDADNVDLIGRKLVVVFGGNAGRRVSKGIRPENGIVIESDVAGMAVHKAHVIDRLVVSDILIAGQAFMP